MAEVKIQEANRLKAPFAGSAEGPAEDHQGYQEALLLFEPGDKRRAKPALARKRNRKKLRRESE